MGFRFRDQADTTAEIIEYRVSNALAFDNTNAGMTVICGHGTVVITGSAIYENGTHGLVILDVAGGYADPENLHVEVVGTVIRDNTVHGIAGGTDFPARLSVVGGRIAAAASQRGINGGFRSLRCSGVRFEGGDYGIVWSNGTSAAEDGEITGCVFEGQTDWGVSASQNSRGVLAGCTFRSTNGFRTLAAAQDWFLSGNDFSGVTNNETADNNGLLTIIGLDAADVDIQLSPKSTGHVRFGTHSAIGAEALSGYIEMKDAGGTVRKLAVVS